MNGDRVTREWARLLELTGPPPRGRRSRFMERILVFLAIRTAADGGWMYGDLEHLMERSGLSPLQASRGLTWLLQAGVVESQFKVTVPVPVSVPPVFRYRIAPMGRWHVPVEPADDAALGRLQNDIARAHHQMTADR